MSRLADGWIARATALLGQCKRCTRSSMIAAVGAWAAALAALTLSGRPEIGLGLALLAFGLTALWLAHLAALTARGTLAAMLREFGAEAREAQAILDALGAAVDRSAGPAGRLREGEALSMRREARPGGRGLRLTRVVISDERGAIAAAELTAGGAYRRLDPASVENGEKNMEAVRNSG
jgi:hypothetical protein